MSGDFPAGRRARADCAPGCRPLRSPAQGQRSDLAELRSRIAGAGAVNRAKFDIWRTHVTQASTEVGCTAVPGRTRLELRVTNDDFLTWIREFGLKVGSKSSYETTQLRTMKDLYLCCPQPPGCSLPR